MTHPRRLEDAEAVDAAGLGYLAISDAIDEQALKRRYRETVFGG
ncbi:MAG: hypothetical protein AAF800_14205 [Planctomycetota bacterium]